MNKWWPFFLSLFTDTYIRQSASLSFNLCLLTSFVQAATDLFTFTTQIVMPLFLPVTHLHLVPYICVRKWLIQIIVCGLFGAKALSEPMLGYQSLEFGLCVGVQTKWCASNYMCELIHDQTLLEFLIYKYFRCEIHDIIEINDFISFTQKWCLAFRAKRTSSVYCSVTVINLKFNHCF